MLSQSNRFALENDDKKTFIPIPTKPLAINSYFGAMSQHVLHGVKIHSVCHFLVGKNRLPEVTHACLWLIAQTCIHHEPFYTITHSTSFAGFVAPYFSFSTTLLKDDDTVI